MSISHVTKELNGTLLMHPDFCILQDIRTRRILGHGTENKGLYYVDEIAQQGSVMLAHGSTKGRFGFGTNDWDTPPLVILVYFFLNFLFLKILLVRLVFWPRATDNRLNLRILV